MDTLPLSIANGWASGISAYAVLLIAGILGRIGYADTPEALQRTDVMIFVGVLLAIEFVADKIPYVDSIWDSIHTVIRPTLAAILGLLIANDASTLSQAVAASSSSITALLSHLAKGGLRLAVNTSPEPVTNVGTSLAEDAAVVGVTVLGVAVPVGRGDDRARAARHRTGARVLPAVPDPTRVGPAPRATRPMIVVSRETTARLFHVKRRLTSR